jgi:hypothetical protein
VPFFRANAMKPLKPLTTLACFMAVGDWEIVLTLTFFPKKYPKLGN